MRAIDDAGNTTPAAAQASARFTVDTTPPPAPSITARPDATTTAQSGDVQPSAMASKARASSAAATATGSPPARAPSPTRRLSLGLHRFDVEAVDAVGNVSAPAGYSWTIAKTLEEGKPFTVTGNASGPLAPGLTRTLAVTLANPNNVAIEVTALTVSVASGELARPVVTGRRTCS